MGRFNITVVIVAVSALVSSMPGRARADGRPQLADDLAQLRRVNQELNAARTRSERVDGIRVSIARQMGEEHLRSRSVETDLFKELAVELPRVKERAAAARRAMEHLRREAHGLRSRIAFRRSLLFPYCPVDQPLDFVDDFGVISMRGGIHVHQGVDLHAPYGTPIRAPFDGFAEIATNLLGGLAVKVLGSTGFAYNAHLSGFGKLGRVEGGDIIGYVGNSGDARSTQPHDHFEWHPAGGEAVDPYPYLVTSCA